MRKTIEIVICETCAGRGFTTRIGRGPDGNGDPREYGLTELKTQCRSCDGSGRQLKTTIIEPYDDKEDKPLK